MNSLPTGKYVTGRCIGSTRLVYHLLDAEPEKLRHPARAKSACGVVTDWDDVGRTNTPEEDGGLCGRCKRTLK